MAEFEIAPIDWAVIIIYIVATLFIGYWVGRNTKDSEDYFLAGRTLLWPLVGFSLYASNMSGSSFVGLAGEGMPVESLFIIMSGPQRLFLFFSSFSFSPSTCVPKCTLCRSFSKPGLIGDPE